MLVIQIANLSSNTMSLTKVSRRHESPTTDTRPAKRQRTSSPLNSVLATTELLEAMLLLLPLSDILRANAVCRRWRDVIAASPAIKQTLFLQPVSSATGSPPEPNPLLQALFPPLFKLYESWNRWESSDIERFQAAEWFQDETRRDAVLRVDASWRKMYPVRPPAKIDFVVTSGWCCTYFVDVSRGVITTEFEHLQERGARMGLIYDILVNLLDNYSNSDVFILWHMFPKHSEEESRRNELSPTEAEWSGLDAEMNLANKITLYQSHFLPCAFAGDQIVTSGLKVADCDPELIKWTDDDGSGLSSAVVSD
jgi:hypothetical protein